MMKPHFLPAKNNDLKDHKDGVRYIMPSYHCQCNRMPLML